MVDSCPIRWTEYFNSLRESLITDGQWFIGRRKEKKKKQKMDEAVRHEKVEDCTHLLSYADKSRGSCGEGFRWLRLGLM